MPNPVETPRMILARFADVLLANAEATTDSEKDCANDELLSITGTVEERGAEIARLIHELLAGDANGSRDR